MIHLNNYEIKAKILSKSFILRQTNPYENIFVSTDRTKAEQARHKLLVEQLKSQRESVVVIGTRKRFEVTNMYKLFLS